MRMKPLILSLALSASLLGGCNMFDRNAPTASNYLLAPPAQAKVEGPLLGTIVVRPASAIRPYDNKGFVYKLANGQWRVDGYNGFLAGPPDMIADALMRACEVSGRFNVVTGSGLATQTWPQRRLSKSSSSTSLMCLGRWRWCVCVPMSSTVAPDAARFLPC